MCNFEFLKSKLFHQENFKVERRSTQGAWPLYSCTVCLPS
jgi:hypothetical protein